MTPEQIPEKVRNEEFCVVKNFTYPATSISAKEEYLRSMEFLETHSPKKKLDPAQLEQAPWREPAIGSRTGSREAYSLVMTLMNRHTDFNSGGGFIETKNGEQHFLKLPTAASRWCPLTNQRSTVSMISTSTRFCRSAQRPDGVPCSSTSTPTWRCNKS